MKRDPNGNWGGFQGTCQRSLEWLDAVATEMDGDRQEAWHACRGVFHALRDRLPLAEAADLAAQLPMLLRGLYYEGFTARNANQRYRDEGTFTNRVAEGMRIGPNRSMPIDPVVACESVFTVLERFVSPGEIRQVMDALPQDVRDLWPVPALA